MVGAVVCLVVVAVLGYFTINNIKDIFCKLKKRKNNENNRENQEE